MKRRNLLFAICIMVVVGGMVAASGFSSCAPKQVTLRVLTFGNQHPPTNGMNAIVNPAWSNYLEEKSGGRIKIDLIPAQAAAAAPDLYDAARTGVCDIACQMPSFVPGRWVLNSVTELPFIFDYPGSRAAAMTQWALFQKYPEMRAELGEDTDVKVIGFHNNGLAQVHAKNKPIKTTADFKGEIVQTLGATGGAMVDLLGGTPENLLPNEMYDAMAKGVITGNLLEWEGEFVWNLTQVVKYSTNAGLYISNFVHVMNLDTWNSLSPDLQALFMDDNMWGELHGWHFDLRDIAYEKLLDAQYKAEGREGIYVLPADERAKWAEVVDPVVEAWVQEASAKVGEAKARAILADARAFAKQYAGYPETCKDCESILKKYAPDHDLMLP